MEEKNEEVEDIDSASSDSFIDDDENDEPSTSGQDDGTRIQVFFAALCFLLVTVKCYLSPFLIDKYAIFFYVNAIIFGYWYYSFEPSSLNL
jgi:hypothetical protein